MARMARIALAGLPHHVVQCGAPAVTVFFDDTDRDAWRNALMLAAITHGLSIHAWAIVQQHTHILATPARGDSLARAMQSLGRRFARSHGARHGRHVALWDGRFHSAVFEPDAWLVDCAHYIESHAALAAQVDDPSHYRWSSYCHHAGVSIDPVITDHSLMWALGNTPFERQSAWRQRIELPLPEARVAALTAATRRGWPLGSTSFIESLQIPGRVAPLAPRPIGRPRRAIEPN